jgi:3-oxoadipate enol-lactonase
MFGQTGRTQRAPIERLDVADLHFADEMAASQEVELPGRGRMFVRTAAGPAGAPTVLLVHGLFATADLNWSLAIPALAERFNVIAPDLRGHGRGMATRRFSAEDCADDLAHLVRALGVGPVIVAGYSLGGLIAQLLVRRHPDVVAGLVLCATAGSFDVPTENALVKALEQVARRAPEGLRRAVLLAVLKPKSAGTPRGRWLMSQVRRHDTLALLDATAEAARFDSSSWLGDSTCPAAVVVTSEDRVVSPAAQMALARSLGNPAVHAVGGDHFACVKRPHEFNAVLLTACVGVSAIE